MYNLYDYLTYQCVFFVFFSNNVRSYDPRSDLTIHDPIYLPRSYVGSILTTLLTVHILMLLIVGVSVIFVCKRFKKLVIILGTPMHVHVDLFLVVVRKLQNSSEHLTTLHPHFLHLCLLANCSKTSLSILEEDISEVDHLDDLFLYCYNGWVVSANTFQFLWLYF